MVIKWLNGSKETMCPISVHNNVHIAEDVVQFSSPDNYWGFAPEQKVKQYIAAATNMKSFGVNIGFPSVFHFWHYFLTPCQRSHSQRLQ